MAGKTDRERGGKIMLTEKWEEEMERSGARKAMYRNEGGHRRYVQEEM